MTTDRHEFNRSIWSTTAATPPHNREEDDMSNEDINNPKTHDPYTGLPWDPQDPEIRAGGWAFAVAILSLPTPLPSSRVPLIYRKEG